MSAPPVGAAPERVTVHVSPFAAATHCKADTPISVKIAPVLEIAMEEPVADTPTALGIDTEMLGAAGALNETLATEPLPMAFEFKPLARQVYAEAPPTQLRVLPAATKAGPGATAKPVTPDG